MLAVRASAARTCRVIICLRDCLILSLSLAPVAACREPCVQKLLSHMADGAAGNADRGVLEHEPRAPSIFLGVVEVRDGSRRQASEDSRVVRLPPSVVALADDAAGQRVEDPRPL